MVLVLHLTLSPMWTSFSICSPPLLYFMSSTNWSWNVVHTLTGFLGFNLINCQGRTWLTYIEQILKDVHKLALHNKPHQLVISNKCCQYKHDLDPIEAYDLTNNSSSMFFANTLFFNFNNQTQSMNLNLW